MKALGRISKSIGRQIIKLRKSGRTTVAIAKKYHLSESMVFRYCHPVVIVKKPVKQLRDEPLNPGKNYAEYLLDWRRQQQEGAVIGRERFRLLKEWDERRKARPF